MYYAHNDILSLFVTELTPKQYWHSSIVEKYCEVVIVHRVCQMLTLYLYL